MKVQWIPGLHRPKTSHSFVKFPELCRGCPWGCGLCLSQDTKISITRFSVFKTTPVLMVTDGPSAPKYRKAPGQREDVTTTTGI